MAQTVIAMRIYPVNVKAIRSHPHQIQHLKNLNVLCCHFPLSRLQIDQSQVGNDQ